MSKRIFKVRWPGKILVRSYVPFGGGYRRWAWTCQYQPLDGRCGAHIMEITTWVKAMQSAFNHAWGKHGVRL